MRMWAMALGVVALVLSPPSFAAGRTLYPVYFGMPDGASNPPGSAFEVAIYREVFSILQKRAGGLGAAMAASTATVPELGPLIDVAADDKHVGKASCSSTSEAPLCVIARIRATNGGHVNPDEMLALFFTLDDVIAFHSPLSNGFNSVGVYAVLSFVTFSYSDASLVYWTNRVIALSLQTRSGDWQEDFLRTLKTNPRAREVVNRHIEHMASHVGDGSRFRATAASLFDGRSTRNYYVANISVDPHRRIRTAANPTSRNARLAAFGAQAASAQLANKLLMLPYFAAEDRRGTDWREENLRAILGGMRIADHFRYLTGRRLNTQTKSDPGPLVEKDVYYIPAEIFPRPKFKIDFAMAFDREFSIDRPAPGVENPHNVVSVYGGISVGDYCSVDDAVRSPARCHTLCEVVPRGTLVKSFNDRVFRDDDIFFKAAFETFAGSSSFSSHLDGGLDVQSCAN